MSGIDPSSRSVLLLRWRKTDLVLLIVGILAFVLWTLPNWEEFWRNVSQFPQLWQIPTNRQTIIYLTIKIASPLLLMGIAGIILWLSSLIQYSQSEEEIDNVQSEHMQQRVLTQMERDQSTSFPMREQIPKIREVWFSTPSYSQGTAISMSSNPETPIPPTLSSLQTLSTQAEEAKGTTFLVNNEQPVILSDQKRANSPVSANLTETSSAQITPGTLQLTLGSERSVASGPLISIRLLKDVSIMINVPGGGHVVVPLTLNAKRVQLLAYIAWRRGELIDRDKILEHVFGWGLSDEEATEDKLSERFESHKKLLRKKIKEVVIEYVNKPAGRQRIDPDLLDPFMSDSGFWGISNICRVEDIEVIETNHKIIALARKDGKLVDGIPEYIVQACERLIASYSGDFLESLIKKYPSEFRAWQGRSSWARKPFTLYRDYYLDALWCSAEYEWQMGLRSGGGHQEKADLRKQQEYFGRAAQKYQNYAMYACNTRYDAKATFGPNGEYGERIGMSERAMRRCLVLLGAIGRTDLINQSWSAYVTQMKSISDHRWQPSKETLADVQAVREQTNAYRFAAQVSQMSAFAERQDRVS